MYKKIMVPLDGSELAECVLPQIEAIIKKHRVTDIFFVHVVQPVLEPQIGEYAPVEKAYAEDYLEDLVGRFGCNNARLHVDVIVGRGIAESLDEYAVNNGADLIVMASQGGSGMNRLDLGSVADRVLQIANVPVLMIRAPGFNTGIEK